MGRIDTVKTEVFKFDELSEEAQQAALRELYDLNVDHEWWDCTYEDAERIGLNIIGFDLYRGTIEGEFAESLEEVCRLISEEHGQSCETYQTAANYLEAYRKVRGSWEEKERALPEDYQSGEEFSDTCIHDDIEAEFLNDLLEDYRIMLSKEYDYRTGEEAIKETIEANDYGFTAEGKLY